MPKGAPRQLLSTKNPSGTVAQEESTRGTPAQVAIVSIGERPRQATPTPKQFTIGQFNGSIGTLEEITVNGECCVVEEVVKEDGGCRAAAVAMFVEC